MNTPHLLPALLTGLAIYLLYEQTDQHTTPLSARHLAVAEEAKRDLARLMGLYYDRYLSPHDRPQYQIIAPASRSETRDKSRIYLLINDPLTGQLFDYNTILQAGAHECAHVLCRVREADSHGPAFASIMSRLDQLGRELQLYDPDQPIPPRYNQLCA
jgi:hypothetical protein